MSKYLGNLQVFDYKSQDWHIFKSRLEQFLKLNNISDDLKSAVLLTNVSDETYRLINSLVYPTQIESVSYAELLKKLDSHFTPVKSTFAERAKFYEAVRASGESIEDWAARLRSLAVYCEFETALDELLRDRFILGLSVGPEKDRLFEQNAKELTFAKAVEVARQAASARQARAPVAGPSLVKEEVLYRVSGERGGRAAGPQAGAGAAAASPDQTKCQICGLKSHMSEKCRFKGYKCQKCGRKGHLKRMCCNKSARLHNMDAQDAQADDIDHGECKECDMFNLRYVKYDPLIVDVTVNNKKYEMELDSGSGVSVISYKMYLENFSHLPLSQCSLKMCFYNGHKITPVGYITLNVSYYNKTQDIVFYVINNGGPPLVGRDFMAKYGLQLSCNNLNFGSSDLNVQHLLNEFKELWLDELGCFNKFEVKLQLKDNTKPRFFKSRSVPFALKDKVEEELDRLVCLGILVPVKFSEYATPIVPVLKENGKVRIAGDFSVTLNKDLQIEKYPMPRIEEVFAKLGGGEHYSKIDLSNAYNQFRLTAPSQELTTINTPKGLFKYTRLVYGLANAPAIFQNAMESLLSGIEGVSIWLDDLCVTGPNKSIHLQRLREVLSRLNEAGLRLQRQKCALFQDKVTYLGYVIDKHGLHANPEKIEAIVKAPEPTNVTEVKRYLGMVNYYRKFIPNASEILSPLCELLRSGASWEWGPRQRRAVADDEIGHDGQERPIAFASRSLAAAERNYSQIQKEATAIIFGVKHFHQYLYGRSEPFVLKTDHKPLISIFNNKNGISVTTAARLQRYALILSAYNYTVQYTSGENNLVADYFSRAPLKGTSRISENDCDTNVVCNFLNANVSPITAKDIKVATHEDHVLQTVIKYMKIGWPRKISCRSISPFFYCKTDLEYTDGCLLRGHRVVVPSIFRDRMLRELHSSHMGITKTKSVARSRMWWPGIDRDIEQYVGSCTTCASVRPAPPRVPPAPWPPAAGPWQRIHIDYMSLGPRVYLVVIDSFSKWLECLLMNSGTSTHALIVKLKYLFSSFGIPRLIVSDNDVKICSAEFKTFCNNNGIDYVTSPIYHPCSNGQAENSVKTCKKMLKCIADENLSDESISEKLLGYLFNYRNSPHCTTGVSPAKLMFGRDLLSQLDLIIPASKESVVNKDTSMLKDNRLFEQGDVVWARSYQHKKTMWSIAIVKNKLGNRMYEVLFRNNNTTCKRHADQLIRYSGQQLQDVLVSFSNNGEDQNTFVYSPPPTTYYPSQNVPYLSNSLENDCVNDESLTSTCVENRLEGLAECRDINGTSTESQTASSSTHELVSELSERPTVPAVLDDESPAEAEAPPPPPSPGSSNDANVPRPADSNGNRSPLTRKLRPRNPNVDYKKFF
ncbi:hypothetical protein JYU34_006209 [Plutella xylostella]|uniref:RNA-directed DNA polymerase n=1 Tax=Plutella xylostella TaxID=51655 RepID=A0ABQ7QV83_PLUXY|nr:hypothetical protein JYU34_006209 [Plutella xylostella]